MPSVPAQVPYSGTPTTTPAQVATPGIHVNAPEAAFGSAVAAGISNLGSAVEGAGKELFGQAMAIQNLNNESDARDADTQYMIEAGKLHAAYSALEGKQRVDAYDGYAKNLQDLGVKIRNGLGNPSAQKMYDASSLSTLGRTIFNGAGQAATAQVQYNEGTLRGQTDQLTKTIEDNPNDESLRLENVEKVKANVAQQAGLKGFDMNNPMTKDMQSKAVSEMAARRIMSVARNQPYKASQMFEDYKSKGLLYGNDANVVEGKVQGFAQTVGAATIADQVMSKNRQDDGTFKKSFEDMQAEAARKAVEMYPNDPKMEQSAKAAFDRNYNQLKWAKGQDTIDRKHQISTYITKGVTDTSMLPPSLVQQMTPEEIKQYPAQANQYRHSLDVQTNTNQYDKLLGMYNNNNTEFMNTNIYQVPGLSKSNIDFFTGLQRKANANGDPRVTKAMSDIKTFAPAALDALQVTGPRMDRDVHNQFTGALHSALQAWHEEYGKPPSPKDLQETIYPSLLRKVAEPGWLWGTNQVEQFKTQLPAPVLEQATKQLGHEPTETELEQVRSEYMRQQFNEFYKGSKAKLDQRFPAGVR